MRVNKTLFKSVFIIQSQAPNRKCRYSVQFTFSKTRRSLLGENNVIFFFGGKFKLPPILIEQPAVRIVYEMT